MKENNFSLRYCVAHVEGFRRSQRCNLRLMLKRSFRLIYIYGVLDCFKLFQVVSVMEITGGFGFNPVLSPAVCTLFEYLSKPEYGIHQMNQ
ncbi:unnamed protein product, partial [Rotaria magnacalcarata]